MKKRVLSILLVMSMMIGILVPLQVTAADGGNTEIPVVDTIWYDSTAAAGTVFEIADAADLRGAARLSQQGVTFSGYTLKLTNNIDLNPGWSAEVEVTNGVATLPEAPTVEFEGFATFAGTLDGNGKTLSGIYMAQRLIAGSANLGFIEILKGTVKNIVINNSLIFADIADGVNDCKVGGIAARTDNEAALIDTVYADINVWYRGWSWQRIAGIVGKTNVKCTIKNIAFVGTVGVMDPNYAVPNANKMPSDMTISQLVGDGNWNALVLENCSMKGTVIAPSNVPADTVDATAPIGKCVGDSVSLTNVGVNVNTPTAVATMNPTAYTNSLAAFNLWPSATADSYTATYDQGKQAYVKYYQSASKYNYTTYLSTLDSNGYTKCAEYTIGSNSYALYQKVGAYSVFVSFLGTNGTRMRVFVEPFGTAYNLSTTATEANVCSAQIWQLDVDNTYSKEDGGMAYVIRLTDGTFIVVDSGYQSEKEADNLYATIAYNNPNSGKPVIRAWFITHLHNDHIGGLTKFATKYASKVTVEGFYYNFPGNDVDGAEHADPAKVASIKTVEMAMNMFDGAVKYRKIHSGMTFGFAGVTATVLGTHEDVKQSYKHNYTMNANDFKDGNDTSSVIKFTVGSQSFLVLGDARTGMSRQLQYSYSASDLKSDIVQMAHHGYTGVQDELYKMIDADVVLWPMDVVGKDNVTLFSWYLNNTGELDIAANDYVRKNAQEIIPSYENVCLTMPYTAKTYSGGNKTVDLDAAYEAKMEALKLETATDTTWYTANPDATTFYLWNAGDVRGFASLAAGGNNFAGKTIMLMNNIDLNPGWNAEVKIDSKVNPPTEPVVKWPEIASFKGVLDGNGYTLKGIYSYKSVVQDGAAMAKGGLFNVLDGGTVKNIKIDNSFMLVENTGWGDHDLHVGGIAGEVNAGSVVTNVYITEDVEIWFKAWDGSYLGGIFGVAKGKYTLNNVIFLARIGYTGGGWDTDYASTNDSKQMYVSNIVVHQGGFDDTPVNNSLIAGTIYCKNNKANYPAHMGIHPGFPWNIKQILTGKQTAEWLAHADRAAYRNAGFVYNETLGSAVPGGTVDMIEGTFDHKTCDSISAYPTVVDANTYAIYSAEELLSVLNSGGDFSGKTIMLMNDIDLNPGWNATVTIGSSTITFPSAAPVAWPNIASFKGTFDGNGYTLKGLYKSMTVSSNTGAYGGLFNTLAGGTVKNLRISNSFILATNSGSGSTDVHVGGISGNVAAGSNLYNVYMDKTVGVWHKTNGKSLMGGAFAYASGKITVKGFVFIGTMGYTNHSNAAKIKTDGSIIAGIIAVLGNYGSTLENTTTLKTSIHNVFTSAQNWGAAIGQWCDNRTANQLATTAESAEWLLSPDSKNYANTHVWSEELQSIIPKEAVDLINGTYSHIVDSAHGMDTPEILYQTTAVKDGKYNIRFVSGITNLDLSTLIGFDIEVITKVNETETSFKIDHEYTLTNKVYESLMGAGKTIVAKDEGDGDYYYAIEITGVAADAKVVFNVAGATVDLAGNTIVGQTVTFSFYNGNGAVVAR